MKPLFPDAFKKIEIEGQDFELIPATKAMTQETWKQGWKVNNQYYLLKPVKKTEKKEKYYLLVQKSFSYDSEFIFKQELDLTPPTANKLSEAISALVGYVTIEDDGNISVYGNKNVAYGRFEDLIRQARQSFQESQ